MDTTMDTTTGHAHIRTKRILFVTNPECGQANTILAMGLEASTRPNVEVHIASFPKLEQRVVELSPELNFHPLDGKAMGESLTEMGVSGSDIPHPPRSGAIGAYKKTLMYMLVGWEGEAYVRICDSIRRIIVGLDPDLIVVDCFLNPAFDACYSLGREFVLNTPNTLLDVVRDKQPWLGGLWRYPMFGTGISYPISLKDMPLNIMAGIALIWMVITSREMRRLTKYRNAHGLPGYSPAGTARARATHIICPCVREADFPLVVPGNVGLYGAIALDTAPIGVSDPALNQWLDRGETVVMCMGTHFRFSEAHVKAVIYGFLGGITEDSNTQLLWKLPGKAEFEDLIEDILKDPRDKDRFKIVDWLEADPASILKHPNVIVWAHHGGANSYFEGTLVGVPQIILGQWYDLYEMAVRAEYLGIGIYGNKNVAPGIDALEFGAAVSRLVRPGKESEGFRTRAKALAIVCQNAGGKRAAVDKLLGIIDNKWEYPLS